MIHAFDHAFPIPPPSWFLACSWIQLIGHVCIYYVLKKVRGCGQGCIRTADNHRRRSPPPPPLPPPLPLFEAKISSVPFAQEDLAFKKIFQRLSRRRWGDHRRRGPGQTPHPFTPSPPPLFLRGGAGQAQERGSATWWGRAAHGADRQGRPSQRRGAAARLPPRGGGALEPWLHSASAVIGRGGRPTPHSRTCTCGRGWGSAQPEVWAGSLLRGSHIGRRPRSFRRAAIRWGAGGGKGLIYLYTAVYR